MIQKPLVHLGHGALRVNLAHNWVVMPSSALLWLLHQRPLQGIESPKPPSLTVSSSFFVYDIFLLFICLFQSIEKTKFSLPVSIEQKAFQASRREISPIVSHCVKWGRWIRWSLLVLMLQDFRMQCSLLDFQPKFESCPFLSSTSSK